MPGPINASKREHVERARDTTKPSAADAIRKHVDKQAAATERRTGHGLGVARLLGDRTKSATKRNHL